MPKLKAFNKNENEKPKKFLIGAPIALALIITIAAASSYAIFQREEDALLINATVGDFTPETFEYTYTVDGEDVEESEIPTIEYKDDYEVEVDCGSTAEAEWDYANWNIQFTKKNTKQIVCAIEFTTKGPKVELVAGTDGQTPGDEVKIGEEHFYVIFNDDEKITLLSKFTINISELVQYDASTTYSTYATAFSTSIYWTSRCNNSYPCNVNGIESTDATVVNAAKSYGTNLGGTGRLLTYEEVRQLAPGASESSNSIKGAYASILRGTYAADGCLYYWLGSGNSGGYVWNVSGSNSTLYDTDFVGGRGVRPVIEVPKSMISNPNVGDEVEIGG